MLERFRAALRARPGARGADAPPTPTHYPRELAARRASCSAPSHDVHAADARARGGRRACTRGRSGRSRASGSCAPRSARRPAATRSPARPPRPGFAAALGALFAELGRSLVGPARFGAAVRVWGRAATRRRTPASSPRSTRPTTAGSRRSARRRRRARAGGAGRAARAARAWGGRPVFLYGFDDLTPLQLDAVETLAPPADVMRRARLRARPRGVRGPRGDGRAAQAAGGREHELLEDRSEHYAPRAPAARCTTSSAGCSSPAPAGCRRTAPCGCWRRAASVPRRSWSAPRCSS